MKDEELFQYATLVILLVWLKTRAGRMHKVKYRRFFFSIANHVTVWNTSFGKVSTKQSRDWLIENGNHRF